MGNELSHHALLIQRFHTLRLAQSYVTVANQICLRGNRDVAHGNLPRVTRPFPVRDTESGPHWGWLGLACETIV